MNAGSYDQVMATANALAAAGQIEQALAHFGAICQSFPRAGNPAFRCAELLTQQGRFEEALPHFERAVALAPQWIEAREVHGRTLWCAGHGFQAEQVWRNWRHVQSATARAHGRDPDASRILDPIWVRWLGNNAHLDCYVKIGLLGWRAPGRIKVLAPPGQVANPCYLDLWRRHVDLVNDPAEIERLTPAIPFLGDSLFTMVINGTPTYYTNAIAVVQREWERQGRAPLLSLDDELLARGDALLRRWGLPADAWFVGLHVREPGFWREGEDRTNRPRVADIGSYVPAIERVVSRGGWVVRLGDASMRPLPPMPGVIDYALGPDKTDWMDIYLAARCRFMINTNSALYQTCASFGTPSVVTNWVPLSSFPMNGGDIVLPKLLRSRQDGTLLSFDRMLALPRDVPTDSLFDSRALDVVDNTADEIDAAVGEMLARQDGAVGTDVDDLHQRFVQAAAAHRVLVNARISAAFLARHEALL